MAKKPVEVIGMDEVAPEVLASALVDIAASAKKLLSGPLRRSTIILLIQHGCPSTHRPSRSVIDDVVYSIENLGTKWVK